jgi:glutamyl-tRNA reductase
LFGQAIHAGKRARTETEISRGTTSVSHAAALLVRASLEDLSTARILIIGAGEMAELASRSLQAHGAQHLTCINRTFARAQSLAMQIGGQAVNWYHLSKSLIEADVVITATGAPHTVIHVSDLLEVLPRREQRPLLFVDIAVPRDVEEAVGDLPGVQRLDIDDLQARLDENLALREAAIPHVEQIIRQEAASYLEWLRSRDVAPVIADLRRKAQELAQQEVEDALRRMSSLDRRDQEIIAQMAHRLVNKLLHEPTVRLKARASEGDGYAYAHAVRELFDLNEATRHCSAPHPTQTIAGSHGVASD